MLLFKILSKITELYSLFLFLNYIELSICNLKILKTFLIRHPNMCLILNWLHFGHRLLIPHDHHTSL
jgi:hypothetical protein